MELITILAIFGIFGVLDFFIQDFFIYRYSRKANYDCSKCKLWDCPNHYCNKKRNEFNKQPTNEA